MLFSSRLALLYKSSWNDLYGQTNGATHRQTHVPGLSGQHVTWRQFQY